MRRVRVDPDPCVRDQPGQEVAELGRDHEVVVPLDDQRRHLDPGQPLQRGVVREPPLAIASYCASRTARLLAASRRPGARGSDRGTPSLSPGSSRCARTRCRAGSRACSRRAGGGDVLPPAVMPGAPSARSPPGPAGARAPASSAPSPARRSRRARSRAGRSPSSPITSVKAIIDRAVWAIEARGLPGRRTDARVVDEDDLALGRQGVGQGRVPVVQVAAKVLEHESGTSEGDPKRR